MLDRGISDIVNSCRNFYMQNQNDLNRSYRHSDIYQQLHEILETALRGISLVQQSAYPGWKVDKDYPGYLIKVEPPTIVRAPFHLIPVFPSIEHLENVWEISRSIKTTDDSVICISGSNATLKATLAVNDIDFCEYILQASEGLPSSIITNAQSREGILFRKLSIFGKEWTKSIDNLEVKNNLSLIDAQDKNHSYGKIDFIIKSGEMRPFDVSNVMIFCDELWKSASHVRSFPGQEASLDFSPILPNDMSDPYELGRYIDWLNKQVSLYSSKSLYLKAIKRALSMSRVCFLPDLTDQIKDFLQYSNDVVRQEISEIESLIDHLEGMDDEDFAPWVEELLTEKEIRKLDCKKNDLKTKENSISMKSFTEHLIPKLSC